MLNSNTMKKFFVALFIIFSSASLVAAQDMAQVAETYNNAAQALNAGNNLEALAQFQQALDMATALGESGAETVTNCKNVIPTLLLKIAKGYANEQDIATAITYLEKAVEAGTNYGDEATAKEAKELIQTLSVQGAMAKANDLLNNKDFAGAAAAYKEVIALDAANAVAQLRLGMALGATGDFDGSIAAFQEAMKDEAQADAAKKQISKTYLKKAIGALKAKDNKTALDAAQKSIEFENNANAQKIAGQSALALKQNAIATEAFEAYLALSPNAKDKVQITYQLGTAYQALGDNEKACAYFKEISADPKFGEAARYQITALKCN